MRHALSVPTLAIAALIVVGLMCASPAIAESPPFNPLGEQEILVIPLKIPVPTNWDGKECAGTSASSIATWKNAAKLYGAAPRFTADALEATLQNATELDTFYVDSSYARTRLNFSVLANPDDKVDGWWTAPHSQPDYCKNGPENFLPDNSLMNDVIYDIYRPAINKGQVSREFAARVHRILVVLNIGGNGGQAVSRMYVAGFGPLWSVTVPPFFSAAFINQAGNDAVDPTFFSEARHELGHELGFSAHYFNPCPRFATAAQTECLGPWDPMAWSYLGTEFSSYTRVEAGWIPDTPDEVMTLPPLMTADETSDRSWSVSLAPLEAEFATNGSIVTAKPRVLRLPLNDGETFWGIYAECRQQLGFDKERPRPGGGAYPLGLAKNHDGLVLYLINEYRAPRILVERPKDISDLRFAELGPGESFTLLLGRRRLAVKLEAFEGAPVRRCRTSVRESFESAALRDYNVTFEGPGSGAFALPPTDTNSSAVWVDSSANGFGKYDLGQDVKHVKSAPFPLGPGDVPAAGRRNRIWFRLRNTGDRVARGVEVTASVSRSPLDEGCVRARHRVGAVRVNSVPAHGEAFRFIPWRPRYAVMGRITVRAKARGRESAGFDNVAVRTFHSMTRLPRSARTIVRTEILLPAADGCTNPKGLNVVADDLPATWRLSTSPRVITASAKRLRVRLEGTALRRDPHALVLRFLGLHRAGPSLPAGPGDVSVPQPDYHQEQLGGVRLLTDYLAASAVALQCPTTITAGSFLSVAGVVNGASAHLPLAVEYRAPSGAVLRQSRLSDGEGHFAAAESVSTPGGWTVRARTQGDVGHLPAESRPCKVEVTFPWGHLVS
jgi:hypothetical protein